MNPRKWKTEKSLLKKKNKDCRRVWESAVPARTTIAVLKS